MLGIVSGSVLLFFFLFLSGLFFRRAWCGWACPVAGLSELAAGVNNRPVSVKKLRIVRLGIFAVWFAVLAAGFVLAGGIRGVDPLYMTEHVVSVDAPGRFIIYYAVLFLIFGLSILIGRRGACHAICWMSPFLEAGSRLGRLLQLPQLRIRAESGACAGCGKCDSRCPMSLPVKELVKTGRIDSYACLLCCECADVCPKGVLKPEIGRK